MSKPIPGVSKEELKVILERDDLTPSERQFFEKGTLMYPEGIRGPKHRNRMGLLVKEAQEALKNG